MQSIEGNIADVLAGFEVSAPTGRFLIGTDIRRRHLVAAVLMFSHAARRLCMALAGAARFVNAFAQAQTVAPTRPGPS